MIIVVVALLFFMVRDFFFFFQLFQKKIEEIFPHFPLSLLRSRSHPSRQSQRNRVKILCVAIVGILLPLLKREERLLRRLLKHGPNPRRVKSSSTAGLITPPK
jgi:hypothetical protein